MTDTPEEAPGMTDLMVPPETIPDQDIDDALAKLSAEFAGDGSEPPAGEPEPFKPNTVIEDFVPEPPVPTADAPVPAVKSEPGVKPKRGRPSKAEKLAAKAAEASKPVETPRVVISVQDTKLVSIGVSKRTKAELARGRKVLESKGYRTG